MTTNAQILFCILVFAIVDTKAVYTHRRRTKAPTERTRRRRLPTSLTKDTSTHGKMTVQHKTMREKHTKGKFGPSYASSPTPSEFLHSSASSGSLATPTPPPSSPESISPSVLRSSSLTPTAAPVPRLCSCTPILYDFTCKLQSLLTQRRP